ncbi:MAG TPA: phosphoglycerate mutase family protein, partial [Longimicrobiales bacterium]|nr:phosphoglycerate mutase family protein [Longimicrobiales bacterium]
MSRLLLVRHAQASFSADPERAFVDYDRLSPLGRAQAEALGVELAGAGIVFDRVWVGPAERHRETAEGVGRVYRDRGLAWPEPEELPELGEHDGALVVRAALAAPGWEEERRRLEAVLAEGER